MAIRIGKNDLGGKSIYADSAAELLETPKMACKLSGEETTCLRDFSGYFGGLASIAADPVASLLEQVAGGQLLGVELHDAPYDQSRSGNFLAVVLASGARTLIGVRQESSDRLPPWLRVFYDSLGATREVDWSVSGGFLFRQKFVQLGTVSEFAAPSPVSLSDLTTFYQGPHGDAYCYGRDGKCYSFDHERECAEPVEDPEHLMARLLPHARAATGEHA